MAVYFISDLHLGHKSILKFSGHYRDGETVAEHNKILIDKINSRVNKRDKLFILGDVVWFNQDLSILDEIHCREKHLILGNHDEHPIQDYLKYFHKVSGFMKYKGYWLSHAPIHPEELRGCKNIYGHVHYQYIEDPRYICACVEALDGYPISFEEIQALHGKYEHYDRTKQLQLNFEESIDAKK